MDEADAEIAGADVSDADVDVGGVFDVCDEVPDVPLIVALWVVISGLSVNTVLEVFTHNKLLIEGEAIDVLLPGSSELDAAARP